MGSPLTRFLTTKWCWGNWTILWESDDERSEEEEGRCEEGLGLFVRVHWIQS